MPRRRSQGESLAELERKVDAAAEKYVDAQHGWMWGLKQRTPAQIEAARQELERALARWEERKR